MTNYKKYQNILVYSFANLGDVLLATSAIALLRQSYPEAHIVMMAKPAAAGVLINNPVIDEVIVCDFKKVIRTFRDHLDLVKKIKNRRFDLAVSFDRKLRPALLTWLAGIPVRVGPDRLFDNKPTWYTKFYTKTIKMPSDIVNRLQVDNYQDIVRQFTGIRQSAQPVMAVPTPVETAKVKDLLQRLPQAQYKIALCVKGTFSLKDWPPERFAALTDALTSRYNASFFIIGAPGDKDYAEKVISQAKTRIANFCGLTSLTELAAVLKFSSLFITVDTGAAHIAATTGVPMVVIYGCTSPKRWHPQTDQVKVIFRELDCCPCAYPADGCPNNQVCLREITVEEVLKAAVAKINLIKGGTRIGL